MKRNILLILVFVAAIGMIQAQSDTMYFMKSNSVFMKQSVSGDDVDSIIFYNPLNVEGKSKAFLRWSEASLGVDVVTWNTAGNAPSIGSLPRFSRDYNWVVVGYYDDPDFEFPLEDLTVSLLDAQEVFVKVIPMTDAWAFTGNMIDSVKNRGAVTTQRFKVVGLYIPPRIGKQAITKINKRAFYPPALDWDEDSKAGAYTDYIRHIYLPNTITEIGDEAFISTNSLYKIEFEQGNNIVTFMEDKNFHSISFGISGNGTPWNIPSANDPQWGRTFLGNETCTTYIMPKYYNAIVEEMFRWTDPDTIVVPASVNYINHRAFLDDDGGGNPTKADFWNNATVRVKVLKFLGTNPPVLRRGKPTVPNPDLTDDATGSPWHIRPIVSTVKRNGTKLAEPIKILVPASAVDAYKSAASWDGFQDYITGY